MAGPLPMPGEGTSLQDVLHLIKAWGVAILTLVALMVLGTLVYGLYWWFTSSDFREAFLAKRADEPEAARVQSAQRKHRIQTATATQLRQLIVAEAPNLVQASNRIPVGSNDEVEELRALASVIPNKKSD